MTRTEMWAFALADVVGRVPTLEECGCTIDSVEVRVYPSPTPDAIGECTITVQPPQPLERIVLSPEATRMYAEFTR